MKSDEAVDWLRSMLVGDPKFRREIEVLSGQVGMEPQAIYRTKKTLGVSKNEYDQLDVTTTSKCSIVIYCSSSIKFFFDQLDIRECVFMLAPLRRLSPLFL